MGNGKWELTAGAGGELGNICPSSYEHSTGNVTCKAGKCRVGNHPKHATRRGYLPFPPFPVILREGLRVFLHRGGLHQYLERPPKLVRTSLYFAPDPG